MNNKMFWFCVGAIFGILLFWIFSLGYDYMCLDLLDTLQIPAPAVPGGVL